MTRDEKTRYNELRFRDLLTGYITVTHSAKPFEQFIKSIYPEFDNEVLEKLKIEILSIKYAPSDKEVLKIYHKAGCTIEQLGTKFGFNVNTLRCRTLKYFQNESICPRTTPEEAKELNTFFEKYDIIFTREVTNNER